MSALEQNAQDLEAELGWFVRVLSARLGIYFAQAGGHPGLPGRPGSGRQAAPATVDPATIPPPALQDSASNYACFVRERDLDFADRLALILALVPELRPKLLDALFTKNRVFDRRFTEFGGLRGHDDEFLPTGETLAFLVGGDALATRFEVQLRLDPDRAEGLGGAVELTPQPGASAPRSPLKGALRPNPRLLDRLTTGRSSPPAFTAHFPARRIETALDWDDLILHPGTRAQVEEIQLWLAHGATLLDDWGMAPRIRPGLRALFYGAPGTGKSLAACLLGKATGRPIYRVDLSLVVSKYVGETEKNLARVFDEAQSRGWILFFDEAEALFGKRGETRDAHDRYANQEVSFLLQRVETFDGVAILATNLRENLDDAFTRRFEAVIHFPVPRQAERLRLWQEGFSARARLHPSLDLEAIARAHTLTGGSIMNVIRHVSLRAIAGGDAEITDEDLQRGIRRELAKEGRAA